MSDILVAGCAAAGVRKHEIAQAGGADCVRERATAQWPWAAPYFAEREGAFLPDLGANDALLALETCGESLRKMPEEAERCEEAGTFNDREAAACGDRGLRNLVVLYEAYARKARKDACDLRVMIELGEAEGFHFIK